MNSRINSRSCAAMTRPRYFHSTAATGHKCDRMETGTQGRGGEDFSYAHTPPYGRGFGFRIATRQQHLGLMRALASARFRARWPPAKASLGQALGGQPESLAVVGQDPDRPRAAVAEDKQAAGKRIGAKFLPADLRQRIDPLPSVHRLHRNQNA